MRSTSLRFLPPAHRLDIDECWMQLEVDAVREDTVLTILESLLDAVVPYRLSIWPGITSWASTILQVLGMLKVRSLRIYPPPSAKLLAIMLPAGLQACDVLREIIGPELEFGYRIL